MSANIVLYNNQRRLGTMAQDTSRIGMYRYQIKEEIDDTQLHIAIRHIDELIKYIEEEL